MAAQVAAFVDTGETVYRVVAADENLLQAIGRGLAGERFDLVVLELSSYPDPGVSRDVARVLGIPVIWVPFRLGSRADIPDDDRIASCPRRTALRRRAFQGVPGKIWAH